MRKTPFILALCGLLYAEPLHASFDFLPADPRSLGMAGAMTAVAGDAFGLLYNPASPSLGEGSAAGAAGTLPYGDDDLRTLAGGLNWHGPLFDRKGTLSVALKRYGSGAWHEETLSAGYSRKVLENRLGKFHAGFSLSRLSSGADEGEESSATGVNAGLQAELGTNITVGISSFNLNAPSTGTEDDHLPRPTIAGLAVRLNNGNLLTADLLTEPGRSARLLAAGEFRLFRSVMMMAGLGTNPSVIAAGAAVTAGSFKAAAAVSRNIDLGTTASFGLEMKL